MQDRLVLGTVQLGLPYGRRAAGPAPTRAEAMRVLDAAWDAGVRRFDTAVAYGPAAERLAGWLVARRRAAQASVTTKVAPAAGLEAVRAAVLPFARVPWVTVLAHAAVGPRDARRLATAASPLPVGQSVYTPEEVRAAVADGVTRVVQAPVHVLDARCARVPLGGAALHARSAYLQGLLLDDPATAERRVPGTGPLVAALRELAAGHGLPLAPALLRGVAELLGPQDRVVVGVDAPEHLDVVAAAGHLAADVVAAFVRDAEALVDEGQRAALDPRRWPTRAGAA